MKISSPSALPRFALRLRGGGAGAPRSRAKSLMGTFLPRSGGNVASPKARDNGGFPVGSPHRRSALRAARRFPPKGEGLGSPRTFRRLRHLAPDARVGDREALLGAGLQLRSEERRVGKEC